MPGCVAFVRSREDPQAWFPCEAPLRVGDKFCQEHRDAIDGIVLGLTAGRHFVPLFRLMEKYEEAFEQTIALRSSLVTELIGKKE